MFLKSSKVTVSDVVIYPPVFSKSFKQKTIFPFSTLKRLLEKIIKLDKYIFNNKNKKNDTTEFIQEKFVLYSISDENNQTYSA